VILVLLLLGLVLWWQQQGQAMRTSDALEPSVAPAAVVPALPPAIAPDIPITSATSTSQEAPAATQAAELAPAPAPAPVTQPIPPAEPAAVQPPVLRLSASNSTWVQVQGATRLRFERTLQAGEAVEFTEDLPLRVVLGRAEAVEVQVHGQPFDIQPHTRSSVARFEVR
jgi:cytoskeleton protein RodZ